MQSLRAALVASTLALGVAGTAPAVPTISVEFPGGSNTLTVTSSSAVVSALVFIDLTADPGTNGYGISFGFDSAGQDLLDFAGGNELLPAGLGFNLTPGCCDNVTESALGSPGSIFFYGLEAGGLDTAQAGQKFQTGTLFFHVTGELGSTDITPFFGPNDGMFSNGDPFPTVTFVAGTIHHPVPEPGTAAMLGLGLLALAVRRRSRGT